MTANLLIGLCAALAATGMFLIGAYCHEPAESAWSSLRSWCVRVHARRVPDYGRHSGIPGSSLARDYPYLPLPAAQVTAHADATWQAAEEYLPPSPQGENPYPAYVPAWLPAERMHADGDPFTGSQPVLTEAAILAWKAERDRERDARAHEDAVRRVVYGEAPVLAVDEAQRLAETVPQ